MVVTDSYNYYSMQAITMHDSTITSQLELAETYYNENIFTRVNIANGQAHEIKCRYYLISQVFLSATKTRYTVFKYIKSKRL